MLGITNLQLPERLATNSIWSVVTSNFIYLDFGKWWRTQPFRRIGAPRNFTHSAKSELHALSKIVLLQQSDRIIVFSCLVCRGFLWHRTVRRSPFRTSKVNVRKRFAGRHSVGFC